MERRVKRKGRERMGGEDRERQGAGKVGGGRVGERKGRWREREER